MAIVRKLRRALSVIFIVGLAAGIWMVHTGSAANSELSQAKSQIQLLMTNKVSREPHRIARVIERVHGHVARANHLTHDPVWWLASHIPVLGRTPTAVRTSISSMDDVLSAVTKSDGDLLSYRRKPGTIVDSALLKIAGRILADVKEPTLDAVTQLQSLNLSGVPKLIADPVQQIRTQFETAQPYVEQGQDFIDAAPILLGLNQPKKWLLVMNNGAEARATGGLPGGWATLSANRGHLELTHLETNSAISAEPLRNWQDLVPQDVQALYGSDLAHLADMNLSPDFPTNARLMNALYEQHTNGRVDGVVSIDEFTLAGLMAVTGPVRVGERRLTAGTVVDYVTKGVYADYPNPRKKDDAVMEITRRVFKHMSYDSVRDVELARALIPSIYRGRLHVWVSRRKDQAVISRTVMAGSMGNSSQPTHMAVVINAAGNKIDAYVATTVHYEQGKCFTDLPYRASSMTVALHNAAPPQGLPDYVTPRNDKGYRDNSKPGSTLSAIFVHVPLGSELAGASIQGQNVMPVSLGTDHGRNVWEFDVELPAQSSRQLQVQFNEPSQLATALPNLGVQPMAIPMQTSVQLGARCKGF